MVLSVFGVLSALQAPLSEAQLWALCHGVCEALLEAMRTNGRLPLPEPPLAFLTTQTVTLGAEGRIGINPGLVGEGDAEHCVRFLPEEVKEKRPFLEPEKVHIFSLGAVLFATADFSLGEDEEPELSEDLEALIGAMTDESSEERCSLDDVLQDCRTHCPATEEYIETLQDLYRVSSSLVDAEDLIPEAGEYVSGAMASSATVIGTTASAYSRGNDIHASLMDEIRSPHPLKNAASREFSGPAPYVTPHERLMGAIRRASKQTLIPVRQQSSDADLIAATTSMVEDGDVYTPGAGESTENGPVLERRRSKIKVPLKLDLAEGDLGDILGGWDPSTQVQLAFAAEAAAEEKKQIEAEEAARREMEAAMTEAEAREQATDQDAETLEEIEYVNFADLAHINRTLFKADLANLEDDNRKMYDLLSNRKLCACCQKTRFNLLTRGKECQMCGRPACSSCIMRISVPPHMLEPPGGQTRGSPRTPPKDRPHAERQESAADVLAAVNSAAAASGVSSATSPSSGSGEDGGSSEMGSVKSERERESSPPRPGSIAASAATAAANVTAEARRGRPILLCTLCRSSLGGARLPLRKGSEG